MNIIENIRQSAMDYITSLSNVSNEIECEGPPAPLLLLPSWNSEDIKIAENQLNDLNNEEVVLVSRANPLPTYKTPFETYLIKINQMKIRVDLRNNSIFSVSMW